MKKLHDTFIKIRTMLVIHVCDKVATPIPFLNYTHVWL